MIVVHGRTTSSNVQKVLWLFDELGLSFERIDRGGAFGGLDDPAYRALNPNGLVPTVIDGDLVLWESHAILRHYARTHPEAGLFPAEPAAAVRADMLLDWNATTLWAGIRPPYWAVAVEGAARDDPTVAERIAALDGPLGILNGLLDGRRFAAGAAFSIADIPLAVSVDRVRYLGVALDRFPAVDAWHARCRDRPGFARVFPR